VKTGITPNVDIRSQGELTLVDRVWISATLIFLALMCFCIVLLAHGANHSVTTQAQAVPQAPTPSASSQPRSGSNREADSKSATIMTQRESYYVAFVSPSVDSLSKVLNQPTKSTKSRGATDKLATPGTKSVRPIREHRRNLVNMRVTNHRRSTADASRRSGRFKKSAPRSVKMLIAMWRRNSRTSKLALNESH
jgi:hypothetical protein